MYPKFIRISDVDSNTTITSMETYFGDEVDIENLMKMAMRFTNLRPNSGGTQNQTTTMKIHRMFTKEI